MWKGDFAVKFVTVLTFFMVCIAKALTIVTPLILYSIVTAMTCDKSKKTCPTSKHIYILIVAYAGVKFTADLV